ncbi:MAG: hypothetical protein V5A64_03005 [Candidatus Thermoplasmatota archaeon]
MSQSSRVPVGFPPVVRKIIKEQVGTLGNSEAEVIKNIVLIYFTERGELKTWEMKKNSNKKEEKK